MSDVQTLERELACAREEAAAGWGRYNALRRRKAVRAALRIASVLGRGNGVSAPAAATEVVRAPEPVAPAPAAAQPGPAAQGEVVAHCWDLGHFYSPVPDTRVLAREPAHSRVWPERPTVPPGIDWRDAEQVALLRELKKQEPMQFAHEPTGDPTEYDTSNEQFGEFDAWSLQAILRHFRPARMIEVGCGFSSLVTARVNREYLGGKLDFTCIEPYPRDFLRNGVDGITRLIEAQVQEVELETFDALGAGDVLFIDTAHVTKTGGDVNRLYLEVLPRLASGVIVHIHDIFFPHDYPESWVMAGRAWNEQYLVQAFLAFNSAFEVLLGNHWVEYFHPEELPWPGAGGGSLWLRRV